jgi:hypothetical protein
MDARGNWKARIKSAVMEIQRSAFRRVYEPRSCRLTVAADLKRAPVNSPRTQTVSAEEDYFVGGVGEGNGAHVEMKIVKRFGKLVRKR